MSSYRSADLQVRWRDSETRSMTQAADALGELAIQLKVPVEMLWERIPGWTTAMRGGNGFGGGYGDAYGDGDDGSGDGDGYGHGYGSGYGDGYDGFGSDYAAATGDGQGDGGNGGYGDGGTGDSCGVVAHE